MREILNKPNDPRPRERLFSRGPTTLTDEDLLAVILGSGSSACSVFELSKKVLSAIDAENRDFSAEALLKIQGIGKAKAALLSAAIEFSRRRIRPHGVKIRTPGDVMPLVSHLLHRKQEHFICITLNGAHEVIEIRIITVGLLNFCSVHPREVFCDAITDRAASIIAVHNHPSGQLEASQEDIKITKQLAEAGRILGIKLLDHVIVARGGFLSLKESGMVE